MPAYQQKAEIIRTEKLTHDIFRFSLLAPDMAAEAKAGQFVMVRIGNGMDPLLRRPFSVHQVTAEGLVQVLFKVIGRGTQMLAEFQAGQYLDVLGPLGRGFALNSKAAYHYLIGGGIGTAPLLFLAQQMLEKIEPSAIKILLGARTGEEIVTPAEDFASMGLEVQAATEDGSYGITGLVTDLMAPLQNEHNVTVYACGPYPMLRAVAGLCKSRNRPCQVSLETIMACGLGACLGCTVLRADMQGYVHVCKEGPVLDADEVAWL